MDDKIFFENLSPITDFSDVFNKNSYHDIPRSWYIAIAGVRNVSTEILRGNYKEVNVVGASAIIAVLNALKDMPEMPYSFNGDGCIFLIPNNLVLPVAKAFLATRKMAWDQFSLNLRAGIVPIKDVLAKGKSVSIAKYGISPDMSLAMYDGGGVACAQNFLEDRKLEKKYDVTNFISEAGSEDADYKGLECRWQPIKTPNIAIVAQAIDEDPVSVYNDVLKKIEEICGNGEECKPVRQEKMRLSLRPQHLRQEYRVQTHGKELGFRIGYALKLFFEGILGIILFTFDLTAAGVEGKKYMRDAVQNTDYQRFDDMLRLTVECNDQQAEKLNACLKKLYEEKKLFYGTVTAKEAFMTCLIFDRMGKHLHFIDGAEGGLALATRNMEEQIKYG